MIKLGSVALDGTPRVAVGFNDKFTAQDIQDAKSAGLDIAEVRIDQFRAYDAGYVNGKLAQFAGHLPVLATIRIESEGGSWRGSEEQRRKLFKAIIPHVDAIDIELQTTDTLETLAPVIKKAGKLLVVSFHDFKTTPVLDELRKIVEAAVGQGADIVKIATQAHNMEHVRNLAGLLAAPSTKSKLIVIGMGPQGLVTRLLFPALGSLMTFGFIGDNSTAPGQLPYRGMFDLLRVLYPAYNQDKLIKLKLMECV